MSRIMDFAKRPRNRGNKTTNTGMPTDTELAVISYIVDRSKRGEVTHKDIAAWFSLRTPQAEEMLRKMEEQGLVKTYETGKMHKQLAVSLTDEALNIYNQALSRIWSMDAAAPREQSFAANMSLASLLNPPEPTEGTTV